MTHGTITIRTTHGELWATAAKAQGISRNELIHRAMERYLTPPATAPRPEGPRAVTPPLGLRRSTHRPTCECPVCKGRAA